MDAESQVIGAMVLFNPEPELLCRAVAAILPQVRLLVLVDNGSKNAVDILKDLGQLAKVRFIENSRNLGVSKALNQALAAALETGADWLLLLDQDSVCSEAHVSLLLEKAEPGAAIVCPRIDDRNAPGHAGLPLTNGPDAVVEVQSCITAGALYDVNALRVIGGWDEDLFVDFVDFDLCIRLRLAGYTILRRTGTAIEHAVGRRTQHFRWIADNHSRARCFHIAKDMVRYSWKHRGQPKALLADGRGVVATYGYLLRKGAIIAAFEEDRLGKLAALLQGVVVGTAQSVREKPSLRAGT